MNEEFEHSIEISSSYLIKIIEHTKNHRFKLYSHGRLIINDYEYSFSLDEIKILYELLLRKDYDIRDLIEGSVDLMLKISDIVKANEKGNGLLKDDK